MNPTNALGWTLLHFLWQGALIAGLLAAALALLRHAGSRARYAASCAAMLVMLICAVATFLSLRFGGTLPDHSAPRLVKAALSIPMRGIDLDASAGTGTDIAGYFPALVWAWFAGVTAFTIRSVGGWALAVRFARSHTSRADAAWEERLAALAKRLRISKPVRLASSGLAQVPAVVGWLRPVVLVPASVFTGLAPDQIDALLAHELAHVRRHDYLINLLQTAAETLFFYHPAVWWVSRKIREERENCCDDLAVEICGSKVAYVRALTDLEQMRRTTPRLAMAADGGSLLKRAQRLLRVKQGASHASSSWTVAIGLAVALLVASVGASGLAQRQEKSTGGAVYTLTDGDDDDNDGDAESYAVVSGNSTITVRGSSRDARRARALRSKVSGDYIWFERDLKFYYITDASTVAEARELFQPQQELSRQQEDLGKQQAELGEQQARLGEQQAAVSVKPSGDLKKQIVLVLDQVERTAGKDVGQEELGDLQSRLGDLQAKVGELQAQAGDKQAQLGEAQAKLGERQAELGEQQARLGDEQARLAAEAESKMRTLLEDAFRNGLARPAE
jgi:beta-lactamase regulating signal transducer with metallopeptidase domain